MVAPKRRFWGLVFLGDGPWLLDILEEDVPRTGDGKVKPQTFGGGRPLLINVWCEGMASDSVDELDDCTLEGCGNTCKWIGSQLLDS